MPKTLCIMFILLALISTVVHAEDTTVALANLQGVNQYPAQSPAVESLDPVLRQDAFEIVQQGSNLRLMVESPIGDIWVSIDDFNGSFSMFNNEDRSNVAAIEVDARKLDSERGFIGAILRGEEFLDVGNFPHMHFVGRDIEWYGNKYAVLKGDMTIKNTTRQVAFYLELIDSEINRLESDRITIKATTTIKRSEFGIYTLIPLVSDNVNLYINVDAVRQDTSLSMLP